MRRLRLLPAAWLLIAGCTQAGGDGTPDPTDAALLLEARQVAARFAAALKPRLQAAMAEGGPASAIEVCAEIAPQIARNVSAETRSDSAHPGWTLKRISLNVRNPSMAEPDRWERTQLQAFDRIAAAGETPGAVGAWVDGQYRALQPQMVQGLCLACHGTTLDPAVSAALQKYYPMDRATGYSLGQVRGAISLTRDP